MLHPIRRLLLHLGQNIPYHLGILAREIPRSARAVPPGLVPALRPDHRHKAQLRPCQRVVQVVFQKVVLRQVGDVAGLD